MIIYLITYSEFDSDYNNWITRNTEEAYLDEITAQNRVLELNKESVIDPDIVENNTYYSIKPITIKEVL